MPGGHALCLGDLSDAELEAVFRAVPCAERPRLACVCRRWRGLCAAGDVWRSAELNLTRGWMMRRDEEATAAMLAWFAARRGSIRELTVVAQTEQDWLEAQLVLGMLCGNLRKLSVLAGPEGIEFRMLSMAFLGTMPSLQSLWVDFDDVHPVGPCRTLPQGLTELTLRHPGLWCVAQQLPAGLSRLTALQHLRFNCLLGSFSTSCYGHSLALVRGLTTLERLDLRGSQLAPLPAWLSQLHRLTGLCLAGCLELDLPDQVGGWHDALAGLPALATLDLRQCALREVPEAVAQLSSLTALLLYGNPLVALREGPYLQNLGRLDLGHTSMDAALPPALLACTSLRRLNLAGNSMLHPYVKLKLSLGAARSLLRRNPGLRVLRLPEGALTQATATKLAASFTQVGVELVPHRAAAVDDPDFGVISEGAGGSDSDSDFDPDSGDEEGSGDDESWGGGSESAGFSSGEED